MPENSDVDLTEFYRYSKPKKPPCKIGVALAKMKPQPRAQLTAALATDNSVITAMAVVTWLEKRVPELDYVAQNITSHRQGKCSCNDQN